MKEFSFKAPNKILFQTGVTKNIACWLDSFAVRRIVIITDQGISGAGLLNPMIKSLQLNSYEYLIFDSVTADPSESVVKSASEAARAFGAELVIGIGGGSSMDVAKVVSVLLRPDSDLSLGDLFGVDAFKSKRLPLLLIPTTAGTGSEVTPISIITTGETTKAGIVSDLLLPDIAILDAELTLGLPAHVTAATGIDAMVHAIEAYTGKLKKNPISDLYATKALALLATNIQGAVLDGNDIQARENMLLGSMLAGQSFANSPVGAVHALAYPLGGHFHIPHGLSNALVLTEVMRFNLPFCAELYAQLAPVIMGETFAQMDIHEVSQKLIHWLNWLIKSLDLPTNLEECGVEEQSLPLLAKEAMKQQRLLINNPRDMSEQAALGIYQKVFYA